MYVKAQSLSCHEYSIDVGFKKITRTKTLRGNRVGWRLEDVCSQPGSTSQWPEASGDLSTLGLTLLLCKMGTQSPL